jgi:hypothetical protein
MRSLNQTSALWSHRLRRAAGEAAALGDSPDPGPDCCWFICNICCWVVC